MLGCSPALTSFSNIFIDDIFTAVFGMVGMWFYHRLETSVKSSSANTFQGIDVVLIMAIACLLKDRKERERYRHIDEKSGYRGI